MAKDFAIKARIKAKDEASGVFRRVASNLDGRLGRSLRGISRSAGRAGRDLKRLSAQAKKVKGSFAALSFGGLALGGVLAGLGFAKLRADVLEVTATTDELGKFARQVGFSVEALQELSFAAGRQGVAVENLNPSIEKLSKRLGQLQLTGTGELKQLEKIDRQLYRSVRAAGTTEQAFDLIVDALARTGSESKKAAITNAAFGMRAMDMARLVDGGTEALQALRAEARTYGLVTEKEAKQTEGFADSLSNLSRAMGMTKTSIVLGMIPALQPLIDRMTEWIRANRELVATKVGEFVEKIGKRLAAIDWDKAIKKADAFAGKLGKLVDGIGGFENIAKLAGLALGINFVGGLAAAISSLGLFSAMLVSNPAGWVLMALAATALVFYKNWETISKNWSILVRNFTREFQKIKKTFSEWAAHAAKIGAFFRERWDKTVEAIRNGVVDIDNYFSDLGDSIARQFRRLKQLWDDHAPEWLKNILSGSRDFLAKISVDIPTENLRVDHARFRDPLETIRNRGVDAGQLGDGSTAQPSRDAYGPRLPEATHRQSLAAAFSPLSIAPAAAAGKVPEIAVRFDNLPEGARIENSASPNDQVKLRLNVGRRSPLMGGAY